jgi:nucleotide-binding universal stress UspA family protein
MLPIRKILAPVDFSARALGTAAYAEAMAERFGAELTVLHVLPPVDFEYSMVEPVLDRTTELERERTARVRGELERIPEPSRTGVVIQRRVAEGEPAAEIVRLAHAEHADLIVMSTQGRGAVRRFLLGSVVSKVLHDSECPVWTGLHLELEGGKRPFQVSHILCAVDLGPHSQTVLCQAAALARHFGSRLSLLHATPRLGFEPSDYFDGSVRLELSREARERMKKIAQEARAEADLITEPGDPDKVVSETAKKLKADLVVIGRGAIAETIGRLRANAFAIIRQSPCPVLSV